MSNITEVKQDNFHSEVLDASMSQPVLVDFWADWCGPCKSLAPILEQLAVEFAGKLKVVKINTDHEQELASQFGIRSLPTVKLFKDGEVVNEFSGLQPLSNIMAFLEPYLPRESDNIIQAAEAAIAAGDTEEALNLLKQANASDPENYNVYPLLIDVLIDLAMYEDAETVLKAIPAQLRQEDVYVKLHSKLNFAQATENSADMDELITKLNADPDDLDLRYQLSVQQVAAHDYEHAMENLLEIIRRDRSYNDDIGRKTLIDVFATLDNQGPLVKKYRRMLASMLN